MSRGFKVGLPQADVGARKPFVSEDGVLRWPVVLIYPEVGATEAIEAAGEDDAIADHLQVCDTAQGPHGRHSP